MAINPLASNPRINSFRLTVTENIEDAVSGELMTQAVTIFPCGHIFNEDTVIQCLARNKLYPLAREPIERYVPNYTIRNLAAVTDSVPVENEGPSEEAHAPISSEENPLRARPS